MSLHTRTTRPGAVDQHEISEGARAGRLIVEGVARRGIVIALIVEVFIFASVAERFLTVANFRTLLIQVAVVGIIAVPGAMLLITGHVDFAVGSIAGVCGVMLGKMLLSIGTVEAVLLTLLIGGAIGAIQGTLITRLGLSTIVVTIGFFVALRGLVMVLSQNQVISRFGEAFAHIGRGYVMFIDIPVPIALSALTFLLGAVVLYRSKWGRHMYAIGGAREAAFRAGIYVRAIPFWLYVASGMAAALGSIVLVSRLDAVPVTLGTGLEIQVLSAVLLGGVAFTGGRGTLLGVLAGVLFIGVLNNGLLHLGVRPAWFQVTAGAALVAAAALDAANRKLDSNGEGAT